MKFAKLVISYDSDVEHIIRTEENVDVTSGGVEFTAERDGVTVAHLSTFDEDAVMVTETGIEICGLIEEKDKANFPAVEYVDWTLTP